MISRVLECRLAFAYSCIASLFLNTRYVNQLSKMSQHRSVWWRGFALKLILPNIQSPDCPDSDS